MVAVRGQTPCTSNWCRLTAMNSLSSVTTPSHLELLRLCYQDLDSLRKMKQMKSILGKFHLTFCRKSVCISPTKFATPTALQKSQNFRSHLKLRWNYSWLPTSWTVRMLEEKVECVSFV